MLKHVSKIDSWSDRVFKKPVLKVEIRSDANGLFRVNELSRVRRWKLYLLINKANINEQKKTPSNYMNYSIKQKSFLKSTVVRT